MLYKEAAGLDARVLMQEASGLTTAELIIKGDEPVPSETEAKYRAFAALRAQGMSVAAIIGRKEFFGRDFKVSEKVLSPRPDTEILVEAALAAIDLFSEQRPEHKLRVLDLCCGSGCIGITLKAERPEAVALTLADISPEALEIAVENAGMLIGGDASIVETDLFSAIEGRFDIIVSNPPYLTEAELATASVEVKREPSIALLGGGTDGLKIIRRLVEGSSGHINPDGFIAIECGGWQNIIVREALEQAGYKGVGFLKDLAGFERVATGFSQRELCTIRY